MDSDGKGRKLIASEMMEAGEFICAYDGKWYLPSERNEKEMEYFTNGEKGYILQVELPKNLGLRCIDATRQYDCIGRYICIVHT